MVELTAQASVMRGVCAPARARGLRRVVRALEGLVELAVVLNDGLSTDHEALGGVAVLEQTVRRGERRSANGEDHCDCDKELHQTAQS